MSSSPERACHGSVREHPLDVVSQDLVFARRMRERTQALRLAARFLRDALGKFRRLDLLRQFLRIALRWDRSRRASARIVFAAAGVADRTRDDAARPSPRSAGEPPRGPGRARRPPFPFRRDECESRAHVESLEHFHRARRCAGFRAMRPGRQTVTDTLRSVAASRELPRGTARCVPRVCRP